MQAASDQRTSAQTYPVNPPPCKPLSSRPTASAIDRAQFLTFLQNPRIEEKPKAPVFVQCKLRGVTYCARLRHLWGDDHGKTWAALHLITPEVASTSVPESRTLPCSGVDGRCTCAGERATNLVAAQ